MTLPYAAARSSCVSPAGISLLPIGGLPQVVDDERERRVPARESRDVAEMVGKDGRQLEQQAALLEQRKRGLHLRTKQPVRIGLRVDEMADRAELRISGERVEASPRGAGLVEPAPGCDCTDPRHAIRQLEHVVGVAVVGGALDEHRRRDAGCASSGSRSGGSKARLIASCSPVIQPWARRAGFQKCWWASTIMREVARQPGTQRDTQAAEHGSRDARTLDVTNRMLYEHDELAVVDAQVHVANCDCPVDENLRDALGGDQRHG